MGRYRIDIRKLAYQRSSSFALHEIHIEIPHDQITLIAGESGCGKTTLLRMLKKQLHPKMILEGTILWESETSVPVEELSDIESAFQIGYVSQQPEMQLVSDQVWHELAFGLENMGMDQKTMQRRLAETVSFLGLEELYHTPLKELSGGQKQMLNLASILIMRPKVILLDEPTSQLDPVARQKFYDLLLQIHQSFDIGMVMVEHSLEPLLPYCDQIIYLEKGSVAYQGKPEYLYQCSLEHSALLPFPARYMQENKRIEEKNAISDHEMRMMMKDQVIHEWKPSKVEGQPVLTCEHMYIRYHPNQKDILRDLSLQLKEHEILCLFGGNGSGKTTFLKVLNSKQRKRFGKVDIKRELRYLPQDPRCLFVKDSLLQEYLQYANIEQIEEIVKILELEGLLNQHPYDISGGELQRAALGLLLLQVEKDVIFLLDEPSKGLDMYHREQLAKLLRKLSCHHTILMVSHDVEFAALCADRCGFLFDGAITSLQDTRSFFLDNAFYTTYWRKCTRDHDPCAITYQEVIS